MTKYQFLRVHTDDLDEAISAINRDRDKIVAVTQNGNSYTIFYEVRGNWEEE